MIILIRTIKCRVYIFPGLTVFPPGSRGKAPLGARSCHRDCGARLSHLFEVHSSMRSSEAVSVKKSDCTPVTIADFGVQAFVIFGANNALSRAGIVMTAHIGCGTWRRRFQDDRQSGSAEPSDHDWSRCFVD
ncbi:unnamed protein product [Linum tenue]|uniref:Uncharacterized protein n=1 Tax=Linum tenue TaxID=586396 RepID=A0AAV0PS99_9ROSI|nr:unnamed protein product [Linum tenue]